MTITPFGDMPLRRRITTLPATGLLACAFLLAGCGEGTNDGTTNGEGDALPPPPADTGTPQPPQGSVPPNGQHESPLVVKFEGEDEVRAQDAAGLVLHVTNAVDTPVQDVVVHYTFGGSATSAGDAPEGQVLREPLGRLEPGETRRVNLSQFVQTEGELRICAWATGQPTVCRVIEIVQPELRIERAFMVGDRVVDVAYACDDIDVVYTITNTGTGTAEDVVVVEDLPAGLANEEGTQRISLDVGAIESGKSEQVRASLSDPLRPGRYRGSAVAGNDTLRAQSRASELMVVQPALQVIVDAPSRLVLGRAGEARVSVRNTGNVPARDAVLVLPEGEEWSVVGAADDTEIPLGNIPAGESRSVRLMIEPQEAERLQTEITARAYCAQAQTRQLSIAVQGIPALQLEMIDEGDTFQVGEEFDYAIRVTNEGTAADLNIELEGHLPPGLAFVSAAGPEGADEITGQGGTVSFPVLRQLEPGEHAEWTVRVRGTRPGKFQRFELVLNSDSMRGPITETETTTVY